MELYGISGVAKEAGIHPSSLRRWEGIGLIIPKRVSHGHTTVRVYSTTELHLLKRVRELLDSGMQLRVAFALARTEQEMKSEEEPELTKTALP
jgi:DNA-binding transcriptional MerR regulator